MKIIFREVKMELLDIVDENGIPTGRTIERALAHATGAPHRTSHVWLLRKNPEGKTEILLQKRSAIKDCFPNCYDISSAGHIPAGSDYIPSALRELKEELGITARADELIYIGSRHASFTQEFYGKPFKDDQFCRIYLLIKDTADMHMTLQKEEISEAMWMTLSDCITAVKNNAIPNCIALEELLLIRDWCDKNY